MTGMPCPHFRRRRTARTCLLLLFLFSLVGFLCATLLAVYLPTGNEYSDISISNSPARIVIQTNSSLAEMRNKRCTFHTCVDVYRCLYEDGGHIWVYVYPYASYVDENGVPVTLPWSREFTELVEAVKSSKFYTPDVKRACFLIPPVDLLNQNRVRLKVASKILNGLPHWRDGANHLLFNLLPGTAPDFNTTLDVRCGKAIVAGGGFDTYSYRPGFDISIPPLSPVSTDMHLSEQTISLSRPYSLIFIALGLSPHDLSVLKRLATLHSDFLLLQFCDKSNGSHVCLQDGRRYPYPRVLKLSSSCLILRGSRLAQPALYDALAAACVPVIIADHYVLPFDEVIDWSRASIRIPERNLSQVVDVVKSLDAKHILKMRQQGHLIYRTYMSSMAATVLTSLQMLNDRIIRESARGYEDWNELSEKPKVTIPSLFLPFSPPRAVGFTAVILTYDRLESLYSLIYQVAQVPSLVKILVIWNNQIKAPPEAHLWPRISKPVKVIQQQANKLSNRFYPYDEIETECILALDDDITMMTKDELEFGFQVWREFPDRLVGFPSRLHLWDNRTMSWKYESEWTSAISMVLTGVAFYHKYYSFLYTNNLPGHTKSWVDHHMNCEDIAMNFLISNVTGKAPIKITPRQKFKCTECSTQGALSADLGHLVARSECVREFAETFGTMPLKTVEFRADPVLYKDGYPQTLLRYRDIGSL